ncbi:MAG: arginine deiminase-related protein [Pirellulaceae bacterium]|jgi:N-dimethylarginine dimethylaminohydrolase|nr:arginine deiminase-related protein [Pirellulaceae bacterium]
MRTLPVKVQPHILMCPPTFFGIEYEINPWMSRARQADQALAMRQWESLRQILKDCGTRISLQTPQQGLPDMVFTANAGLIYGRTVVLSRFRYPQRQGEHAHNTRWFEEHGFTVLDLTKELYFEGAGDALFCGDTLYAGYRSRSDMRSHQLVAGIVGQGALAMELVDPYYYHLDTCFCPLMPGIAAYFPGAFDQYGRQVLEAGIETLIEVTEDEAKSFACNAVVVGKSVVTNTGCASLHQALVDHGFDPVATPLGEFVKAGGSAKCLTLRLDGEEAADWKTNRGLDVSPSLDPGPSD